MAVYKNNLRNTLHSELHNLLASRADAEKGTYWSKDEAESMESRIADLRAAIAEVDALSNSSEDKYTVVGIYDDNGQRFGTHVIASSAKHAEEQARKEGEGEIIIAAVLRGHVEIIC